MQVCFSRAAGWSLVSSDHDKVCESLLIKCGRTLAISKSASFLAYGNRANLMDEGWSNKSWPVFQLQDFYLRGVSPMTPRSKNFEKILEQSQTSQIDHLKVLRKLEVLRWTYLTVQTSRSFRATGHDLFDQPSGGLLAITVAT